MGIHKEIVATYGPYATEAKNVRRWVSMFDSGQALIFDDEWIGRPVTVKTVDNIKHANELIHEDCRYQSIISLNE